MLNQWGYKHSQWFFFYLVPKWGNSLMNNPLWIYNSNLLMGRLFPRKNPYTFIYYITHKHDNKALHLQPLLELLIKEEKDSWFLGEVGQRQVTHVYTFSKGKVKTPTMDQVILQFAKEQNFNLMHRWPKENNQGPPSSMTEKSLEDQCWIPESYATHSATRLVKILEPWFQQTYIYQENFVKFHDKKEQPKNHSI